MSLLTLSAASGAALAQQGSGGTAPADVPVSPQAPPQCYSKLPEAARSGAWTCVEDYVVRVKDSQGRVLENTPSETRLIEPDGRVAVGPPERRVTVYPGGIRVETQVNKGTVNPATSRPGRKRANEIFYRRLVNAYIWEFSARVYYGNGSTPLGSTRESSSVNMNGRQARLNMRLAYDSGGAPIAPRLSWQCRTYVSNEVCGQNGASSDVYTFSSWGIPEQTDYRGSNGRYYYRFFWKFLAQGRPGCSGGVYINPKEASGILTCGNFSPGACQFRDGATEAKPAEPGC